VTTGTVAVIVASVATVISSVAVGFARTARRREARARRALVRSEQARQRLSNELAALMELFADTAARAAAVQALPPPDELTVDAFDPVSGLLRERYVAVLIQQRVAMARRKLTPFSVVVMELDGLRDADRGVVDDAMRTLGGVVRETLREADSACRVGEVVVIAALDDTSENGACMAVERIQSRLRAAGTGSAFTVSAGIACYPTHALEAPGLVACAGDALLAARGDGPSRVATAPGEPQLS
jgi:diguanylate cyclase (GGDEF)-like protein